MRATGRSSKAAARSYHVQAFCDVSLGDAKKMNGVLPMPHPLTSAALISGAVARNAEPILTLLKSIFSDTRFVLEIASGTGEHAIYFAGACPGLVWQPTDADEESLASIAAWRDHAGLKNVQPPLRLDAADPLSWPVDRADVIVAINMIHIAPWTATQGLMKGASRLLPAGGSIFLYGPYLETGIDTAPSNLAFDESLRSRNPTWGLRALDAVTALAAQNGFALGQRIAMPANNLALLFRKKEETQSTT